MWGISYGEYVFAQKYSTLCASEQGYYSFWGGLRRAVLPKSIAVLMPVNAIRVHAIPPRCDLSFSTLFASMSGYQGKQGQYS